MERNRLTTPRHRGVTLLELILALSLSILVLMTISMAINLHFRVLDVRRTNIEEARLASAVLKHMADDLRSAVQYTPPDLSGLEALTSSLTSSGAGALAAAAGQMMGASSGGGQGAASGGGTQDGTGGGQVTGGGGQQGASGGNQQAGQQTSGAAQGGQGAQSAAGGQTQGGGGGQSLGGGALTGASGTTGQQSGAAASGATSTTATTESTETTETTTTSTVVGFFGSATELRFDISRLPRVDQYEVIQSSGDDSENQFPSDLKTVIYFLQNDDNGQAVISPGLGGSVGFAEPSTSGRGRGLMRAEQDRAVLALAEESGIDTAVYGNAKILAEEVVGLAFQYYDGTDWLTDWDSSSTGTLPRAVEIVLTIQPTYAMNERDLAATPATSTAPEYNFRLVVRLPSAPLVAPTPTEETTTDTSSSAATGSTTNSAAGAASGSQAQGTMP